MTGTTLDRLLDDTEGQLDAALVALLGGDLIDLADLPPRVETICRMAIDSRRRDAARPAAAADPEARSDRDPSARSVWPP